MLDDVSYGRSLFIEYTAMARALLIRQLIIKRVIRRRLWMFSRGSVRENSTADGENYNTRPQTLYVKTHAVSFRLAERNKEIWPTAIISFGKTANFARNFTSPNTGINDRTRGPAQTIVFSVFFFFLLS